MSQNKYTQEELKSMNIEEANAELDQDEFELWAELHNEAMHEQADENWKKIQEQNKDAIDTLVEASKDSLVEEIEVMGAKLEVNVSLNKTQKELFTKIQTLQKRANDANLDEDRLERLEKMEQMIYKFLGEISVNYDEDDWKSKFEDVGLTGLMNVVKSIMDAYSEKVKEKQGSVEKFR